jgi:hypothetical protein
MDDGEPDPSPEAYIRLLTRLTSDLIKNTNGTWTIHAIDETELESLYEFLFHMQEDEFSDQLFI